MGPCCAWQGPYSLDTPTSDRDGGNILYILPNVLWEIRSPPVEDPWSILTYFLDKGRILVVCEPDKADTSVVQCPVGSKKQS